MRKIKEKRGNEIVKNMHSNFAKETNQRDEDAEMQKFIEEQLRLKKEQEKKSPGIRATRILVNRIRKSLKHHKTLCLTCQNI